MVAVVEHLDHRWSVVWVQGEYEPDRTTAGRYEDYTQALVAGHAMDERRQTEYGVRIMRLPRSSS